MTAYVGIRSRQYTHRGRGLVLPAGHRFHPPGTFITHRIWDSLINDQDRAVYEAAGYGRTGLPGRRPALLVVDVNYNFVGDRPEPILDSIRRFHNSCGQVGWEALPNIATLLAAARRSLSPVFFTTQEPRLDQLRVGGWSRKNQRTLESDAETEELGTRIVKEIEPAPGELVIRKTKPSAFFGTALASFLVELSVDTVVIAGATTSGCVRATAVDAFSANYKVMVVEDCVFDRGAASHAMSLFDMHAKYADVVSLTEALDYFDGLEKPETT